jgi:phosphoserine phosphatase
MFTLGSILFSRRNCPVLMRQCSRLYTSSGANLGASKGDEIMASLGKDPSTYIGNNVAAAMEFLSKADAVCFDVDSTVIAEEGIDVLAEYLGKGDAVQALTKKAMEGSTKFEDALAARLAILEPSEQEILSCLKKNPFKITPGIDTLVEALNEALIDVYLVSGGFRIMIEPVARQLCIAKSNIIANTILFDTKGNYLGFDTNEPTSADMGKPKALQRIKDEHDYQTIIMVGDGATDAQAKPPADAFIGFGGVITRPAVKEKACWFITDFRDMEKIIRNFREKQI